MRRLRASISAGTGTVIMTRMKTLTSASIKCSAVDARGPGSSVVLWLNFPESLTLRPRISREQEPLILMVRKTAPPVQSISPRRSLYGPHTISCCLYLSPLLPLLRRSLCGTGRRRNSRWNTVRIALLQTRRDWDNSHSSETPFSPLLTLPAWLWTWLKWSAG